MDNLVLAVILVTQVSLDGRGGLDSPEVQVILDGQASRVFLVIRDTRDGVDGRVGLGYLE